MQGFHGVNLLEVLSTKNRPLRGAQLQGSLTLTIDARLAADR